MVRARPFQSSNADLLALAHKLYVHASFDKDWLTVFICWTIIYTIEDSHEASGPSSSSE